MSQGLKIPAFGDSTSRQSKHITSVSHVADVSEIMGSKSGNFFVMALNMTLLYSSKTVASSSIYYRNDCLPVVLYTTTR